MAEKHIKAVQPNKFWIQVKNSNIEKIQVSQYGDIIGNLEIFSGLFFLHPFTATLSRDIS